MTRASTITRAERAVYLGSLGLVGAIALVAALLPGELGTAFARRGYGFFAFWHLLICLFATPWARFHKTRWLGRVVVLRKAIGNAAAFHVAGHVIAMSVMEPIYFIDIANPEDMPGTISSGIVVVLALTSFDRVRKRLSATTWKRIHRWIYVATAMIAEVAISSRLITAVPHMVVLAFLIGYRVALWRSRRRKGHRIARADLLNYAAMVLVVVGEIAWDLWLQGPWQTGEPIGIGIFSGIGAP